MAETSRLSAGEIFERVTAGAEDELTRPTHNLVFSAVSAGLAMGLSGLGVAVLLHALGDARFAEAIAYLAYPLGFLIVIIGRMQLFTENTLFPVALVLARRQMLRDTARLWAVVLVGNVIGAVLFALLLTQTPAVGNSVSDGVSGLGVELAHASFAAVFWTGVVAGWIVALVSWLVTASTDTTAQVVVIFVLTYIVGVAHLAHSVAGSAEVLTAVLQGDVAVPVYLRWLLAAVLGNAVGGVVIVALFNYGQVHHGRADEPEPKSYSDYSEADSAA